MKKLFILIGIMIIATACNQQEKKAQLVKFNGETQGTYYAITYYDINGINYQLQVDSILKAFDQCASLWVPGSIISKVNNNDSTVVLDDYFIDIFNKSMKISEVTNGAFDVTVGQLVNAWGFGFTSRSKLDQHKVDSLMQYIGYKTVKLVNGRIVKENPKTYIDFNAIAQGYSADILAKFLVSKGIENYLIDVGGEVLGKGKKGNDSLWIVGIEKPAIHADDATILEAKLKLYNMAMATSGSYRKYFEENGVRYSHTIDPQTGFPVKHTLLSVSVLAEACWEADGYATAFMVMGLEKSIAFLQKNKQLQAYFIYTDEKGALKTFTTEGLKSIVEEI